MPSRAHQRRVLFLLRHLEDHLREGLRGEVIVAPYPVRLAPGSFREPDLLVVLTEHRSWLTPRFAESADLVVEVVHPDDPERDRVTKRREYALAGIPEYWIVDEAEGAITVLALERGAYVVAGRHGPGEVARSKLLPGFEVDVAPCLPLE